MQIVKSFINGADQSLEDFMFLSVILLATLWAAVSADSVNGQLITIVLVNNSTRNLTFYQSEPGPTVTVSVDNPILLPKGNVTILVHSSAWKGLTLTANIWFHTLPVFRNVTKLLLWVFDPQQFDTHTAEIEFALNPSVVSVDTKRVWNPTQSPRLCQLVGAVVTLADSP